MTPYFLRCRSDRDRDGFYPSARIPLQAGTPLLNLADRAEQQSAPGKAGLRQIDLSDQRRAAGVDGVIERMGSDDGSRGQCFAARRGDSFNVEGSRWDLSHVKDATEKTRFLLLIACNRTGHLELKACVAGGRHSFWPVFRPMVVQRTRKDVDHDVSGQCGDGNQTIALEKLHLCHRATVGCVRCPATEIHVAWYN
jgi:hypothetical protein